MKKSDAFLLLVPFIALVGFGAYIERAFKPRVTTSPFKMVLADVSASPARTVTAQHDVNVTVVIDYQGPTPKWWGAPPSVPEIPKAQIGGTYLVDEKGKTYREIVHPHYTQGIYGLNQTFNSRYQQYIWTYTLNTTFIPPSVHHLTFKSRITHPSGTLQISVPVRDTAE